MLHRIARWAAHALARHLSFKKYLLPFILNRNGRFATPHYACCQVLMHASGGNISRNTPANPL